MNKWAIRTGGVMVTMTFTAATGDYWANQYNISVDRSSAEWITETSSSNVGSWNPITYNGCSWIDASNQSENINSSADSVLQTMYVPYSLFVGATSVSSISAGDAFTTYDHS